MINLINMGESKRRRQSIVVKVDKKGLTRKMIGLLVGVGVLVLLIGFFLRLFAWDWSFGNTIAVVKGDEVYLVRYDPNDKLGVVWKLESEMQIPVVHSDGLIRLGGLWRYGEVEGDPGEVVKRSLTGYLGVWIDGYVYINDGGGEMVGWNWLMPGKIKSDVSLGDRWKFVSSWKGLREDQISEIKIGENLQEKVVWPDGTEVIEVSPDRIRLLTDQLFLDPELLEEDVLVKVVNASGVPGMARMMDRVMTNAGARVVEVSTAEETEGLCWYDVMDDTKRIVKWLDKVGCVRKERIEEDKGYELELWLGREWEKLYN